MLAALPGQAVKSVLCAVLWVALPLVCVLLRPAAFFLSGLAAARGFVLALTVAVGVGREESLLLSLCAAGIPAVLSVSALLAACAMVWQSGETTGQYRCVPAAHRMRSVSCWPSAARCSAWALPRCGACDAWRDRIFPDAGLPALSLL